MASGDKDKMAGTGGSKLDIVAASAMTGTTAT